MARSRVRAPERATTTAKPRTDIYTGLLVVSLLAQIAGAVFLYLDYDNYKTSKPPAVKTAGDVPAAPPPATTP